MTLSDRPVVPTGIARAKRIAKQLKEIYPQHTLSVCQAVTAHLFGFKDWHAVEQAVKQNSPPGIFDSDLTEEEFKARLKEQRSILCLDLAGVDPAKSYEAPKATTEAALEQAVFGAMAGHGALRLENAAARYHIRIATEAIAEISPTTRDLMPRDEYEDFSCIWSSAKLARLPAYLGQWWSVNIPHQPEVGEALRTYHLDPNRPISLIKFGGYWGELCFHYASVIDWGMCMGTAYLIAERYASIWLQQSAAIQEIAEISDGEMNSEKGKRLLAKLTDMKLQFVRFYLDVYPRDDFASVFSAQPDAFIKNAKDCIKIFANPKSKKGTWKH